MSDPRETVQPANEFVWSLSSKDREQLNRIEQAIRDSYVPMMIDSTGGAHLAKEHSDQLEVIEKKLDKIIQLVETWADMAGSMSASLTDGLAEAIESMGVEMEQVDRIEQMLAKLLKMAEESIGK